MKRAIIALLTLGLTSGIISAQPSLDNTVRMSATYVKSPAKIILSWPNEGNIASYHIYRKDPLSSDWGAQLANLPGTSTSWSDTKVSVGKVYEYMVLKTLTSGGQGSGNIYAGIEVPPVENRGTVLLIVENTIAASLSYEIQRLKTDLIGDGWNVIIHNVDKTDKVPSVKAIINKDYAADPKNVKSVFLIGHVPVPYSGGDSIFWQNFAAAFIGLDGHPDHYGAWPADTYYGNFGSWVDGNAHYHDTTKTIRANWNLPGDGKFDQDTIPGFMTLQVGRADFYNMPAFPESEIELTRRYLNKDHDWRMKKVTANERALIQDDFSGSAEAFSGSAYRNFSGMFRDTGIHTGTYISSLRDRSYIWSYGCGPGSFTSCGTVAKTTDFVNDSFNTAFTMLFGSYFGDWNTTNNLLRAALASKGMILTNAWSGRPHWSFHPMAMGETIGYCAQLTQSDSIPNYYRGFGKHFALVNLMGDPTLRMHIIEPPALTLKRPTQYRVDLRWKTVKGALGYRVYRAPAADGPYTRLSDTLLKDTFFIDKAVLTGKNYYMVKTVALTVSGSGSYYNLSEGSMDTVTAVNSGLADQEVEKPVFSVFPNPTKDVCNISLNSGLQNATYSIEDISGKLVRKGKISSTGDYTVDLSKIKPGVYFLKVYDGTRTYSERIVKE